MNELEMRGMKCDAGDPLLRSLRRAIFPVADDRVANRRELHPDLILQSRHQGHANQRSLFERAFHNITKLRASAFAVGLRGQLLKHSFSSKVMNERPFFLRQVASNDCQIFPHGGMGEKLSNECVPIRRGLRKEKDSGREPVHPMYD